ncbi:hypothetical protein BV20DRAFT_964521 [Pilatotrama ljubarskyi]|nr:hypothetical protein BV20DRAFT_964521 [Pilatotrama ljubarskyi]
MPVVASFVASCACPCRSSQQQKLQRSLRHLLLWRLKASPVTSLAFASGGCLKLWAKKYSKGRTTVQLCPRSVTHPYYQAPLWTP